MSTTPDRAVEQLIAGVQNLDLNNNSYAEEAKDGQVYNLPFDRTFPSFTPMVECDTFLPDEHNGPIALLNNQFWQQQQALDGYVSIKERALTWFNATSTTPERLAEIEADFTQDINTMIADPEAQFDRIFIRDAERCFNAPKRRNALCHILTYLKKVTLQGDYHQGLCMMCSFLSCFLTAPQVIAMGIYANENYLNAVWRSQSVATATDGYVLFDMLEKSANPTHNKLVQHFKKVYIIPEMFVSKYWCALAVHLLPFQSIIHLFDRFWAQKQGVLALYELIFIVLFGQVDAIMKTTTTDKALEFVALDHKVLTPTFVNELTYLYPNGDVPDYAKDAAAMIEQIKDKQVLEEKRTIAFALNIEPRIARSTQDFAALTAAQPNCQRAECEDKEESGYYYCLDCKIHLCENCAYSAWDGHNDNDHDVRMNEDVSDTDE